MLQQPNWKIFYDDGSTFSSEEGSPESAPAYGFICAIGYDETGARYIMHGWDHYHYDIDSQQWWGMDIFGLMDRLTRNKVHAYKQGRTVTKTIYSELMSKAHHDPDFPQVR